MALLILLYRKLLITYKTKRVEYRCDVFLTMLETHIGMGKVLFFSARCKCAMKRLSSF